MAEEQALAHVQARIDALLVAGEYREAARALHGLIAAAPNCFPAYRKLGVACLRLQEYDAAEKHLLVAAQQMPGDPDTFDGLAEAYGYMNDVERARRAGRRALVLKDASIPLKHGPPPSVPARPGGTRLVAFSLFGGRPRYCETAILNAETVPRLLPGWICRYYVDDTVPAEVLDRLRAAGAQVITADGPTRILPKTMWRFLALHDRDADAVICRDADSLLSTRETGWIDAWLESGLPFHIIRDYFSHCELMLAGLFGVRGGVLDRVEDTMRNWLAGVDRTSRWSDQHFLRACIWPLARDAALTHDSWFAYGSRVVPGTQIVTDARDHVGANHSSVSMALKLDHPDGTVVRWSLVDATGTLMCSSYVGTVHGGQHVIEIPRSYGEQIQSGEWKVQWAIDAHRVDGFARAL
ncbi:MAG TPA: tetratricopeptide repeat protein [Acetobacteraceae bacterium]|nr:tetratricopeptide repeat protein [Acetobacteraceae bacterium]